MKANKRTTFFRIACIGVVVAFGMLMPACGGGGSGGGGMTNPLTATFTPSNPNPAGNNVISMDGSTAGASFSVVIRVTNVTKFAGAAFRVTYDPDSARFVSFSSSGSLLQNQGVDVDFQASLFPTGTQGEVTVFAGIQDDTKPAGIDVSGTATLITLNFQATNTTSANPIAFDTPREVTTCPTAQGACSTVVVTSWDGGTMRASR